MKSINYDLPSYKIQNRGVNSLSDSEVISLIIGKNNFKSVEKSRKLLCYVNNNLSELAKMGVSDYELAGLTKKEAQSLASGIELGRRKQLSGSLERVIIKLSKDVADIFQPLLSDLNHEEFWIIYLNRRNKIIKYKKHSQGGVSGTITDIKIIMKEAIELLASGIIIAHNHPSGNLNPSRADEIITRKIKQAANLFDIILLDHVIISDKDYYSFADNGLI